MIKRYSFSTKNWLRAGFFTAFAISCSLNLQAQTGPTKQWDKTFGGSTKDGLSSLQQTSDGGYILGGVSYSGISGDKTQTLKGGSDNWVLKVDANGTKSWDKTYGGNDDDALYSLQQTADGGYILGGASKSNLSGDKSQASQGDADFWIVKLSASVTGLNEAEANLAVSVFPNPSQGKFNLQLNGITAPNVTLTIFDLPGRLVLQQTLQVSTNASSMEVSLLAKGIYLLQLKAGEQILTHKIVVE